MTSIQSNSCFNEANNNNKIPRSRNYQERSVPKFLKKVFSILEGNSFNELISWSNDGKALIIKKPTDFANFVLPQFFKHSNFSSFIRQLNMYKFKKSKSCSYDHIYTHPMFQSGRIDLLRNIQRKPIELMAASAESDRQGFKAEENADMEKLLYENQLYKKLHKELASQVELIESKMSTIKSEVAKVYHEQQKSQANENFLKNVLKSLTKVYGFESIAKIIENEVQEESDLPLNKAPKVDLQANRLEENPKGNKAGLTLSKCFDEDLKHTESSPDYHYSEHFSTDDTPQFSEINQISYEQAVSLSKQPLYLLDFGIDGCAHYDNNCDNMFPASPKLSKHNSYAIWVDELKNNESNQDLLFSHANRLFHGDLNIEDF